ncbi:MAG: NAD(P)-binding protein [Candidatus Aminicenantes bacterium]|nr:NAD(P)-binding protein [Candidatus Aminicenantes bacterium]
MPKAIILGAGLSGLSAAYHLEQDTEIYEKEKEAGGLCRSINIDDFIFDYGPHILFPKDSYTQELIKKLLDENLNFQKREAYIYHRLYDTYTRFPFQSHLYGLPVSVVKDCILGFYKALQKTEEKPRDYEEWIHWNFGEGIARHLMVPYAKKIWTVPPKEMNFEWVWNRVPRLTLEELLEGALHDTPKSFGFNKEFWYPYYGGIQALPQAFSSAIQNIHLGKEVTKISVNKKYAEFKDGQKVYYERLISTLPLPEVIKYADEVPSQVKAASEALENNSVYCVNLGIERENISPFHYVYFYEPEFLFHRISYPMNFSANTTPGSCSSVSTEISYSPHKKISRENITDRVVEDLIKAKILFPDDKIMVSDVADLKYAYIIYDKQHRKNVDLIHHFLKENSIFPCGRFGEWEYFNMDHSLNSGKITAEQINQLDSKGNL